MKTSKSFLLFTLACICLPSLAALGQDPFKPFENPFRDVPENETMEQRALALLEDQRSSKLYLESELQALKAMLRQEEDRRLALRRVITDSIERQIQGTAAEQRQAMETLASFLNTLAPESDRQPLVGLEEPIEDFLERGLRSDELRSSVINLFRRHLVSKGVIHGYQPSSGNWRPASAVTEKERTELRNRLSKKTDFHFYGCPLEIVFDDLAMESGIHFETTLSDKQKSLEITYVCDNVTFAKALADLLAKHELDYMVDDHGIRIGAQGDRDLIKNEVFTVTGLLSTEFEIERLVELIKADFQDEQPTFALVDQNSFAVRGSESQLQKVSKFLGSLRPAPVTEVSNTASQLHPAAEFANRVVKAIHDEDTDALAELARISGDMKERIPGLIQDVKGWFRGVNSVTELRRNGSSIFAKVATFEDEVIVIRLDMKGDEYILNDINSPSVEDYEEFETIPLVLDQK